MPLRKSDFGLRKTGVSEIGNTGLPNATSLTRHNIPGECGIRRGFGGVNILIITGLRGHAFHDFLEVMIFHTNVYYTGLSGEFTGSSVGYKQILLTINCCETLNKSITGLDLVLWLALRGHIYY